MSTKVQQQNTTQIRGDHSTWSWPYRACCCCQCEHWIQDKGTTRRSTLQHFCLRIPKRVSMFSCCLGHRYKQQSRSVPLHPEAEGCYPLIHWDKLQCTGTELGILPLPSATPELKKVKSLSRRLFPEPLLCVMVRLTISSRDFFPSHTSSGFFPNRQGCGSDRQGPSLWLSTTHNAPNPSCRWWVYGKGYHVNFSCCSWLDPMGKGTATTHSLSCPTPRTGSRMGPWWPTSRQGKQNHLSYSSQRVFGAMVCLVPHLRLVWHGGAYQGHKAQDNWAPRIIGTLKPLHHNKVVAQKGQVSVYTLLLCIFSWMNKCMYEWTNKYISKIEHAYFLR